MPKDPQTLDAHTQAPAPRRSDVLRTSWDYVGAGWASCSLLAKLEWATLLVATLFILFLLQPGLWFTTSTPTGGDMGAHVLAPFWLKNHFLSEFRLQGWSWAWYNGFPLYRSYMVLPPLLIALLSFVMPYTVAFKLVVVAPAVLLPASGFYLARSFKVPAPAAAFTSLAFVAFATDRSYSIYGGNIASLFAGEFSFAWGFMFSFFAIGALARGFQNGKRRPAAIFFALAVLCHPIAALVVVAFVVPFALVHFSSWAYIKRMFWFLAPVLVTAGLLTAFWVLPFYGHLKDMNDMGWEKKLDYANMLFNRQHLDANMVDFPPFMLVLALAVVGLCGALLYKRRNTIALALTGGILALAVVWLPQGSLWNARLLPAWYACVYLMAAFGVFEVVSLFKAARFPIAAVCSCLCVVALAIPYGWVPLSAGPIVWGTKTTDGFNVLGQNIKSGYLDGWARWNFEGYENKTAWPTYNAMLNTMDQLGKTHGCGRALWEYSSALNDYGTPMAPMLLPYWTNGCIASQEGLYFEASGTTPFHFLMQDETSTSPSDAERGLPYKGGAATAATFDMAVQHMQMMGVKYYMASTPTMKSLASSDPRLTQVGATDAWTVFMLESSMLEPLGQWSEAPTSLTANQWRDYAADWFVNLDAPMPVAGLPVQAPGTAAPDPSSVGVSNVQMSDDSLSFDVAETGIPVLVKASYDPAWVVDGATGPYRAGPNLMVVVPTSNHVALSYSRDKFELLGWALTLAGLVALWFLKPMAVFVAAPSRRRRNLTAGAVLLDDEQALDPSLDTPEALSEASAASPAPEASSVVADDAGTHEAPPADSTPSSSATDTESAAEAPEPETTGDDS